uniref:Putative histone acetyltransferase pcaf/saga/ada subunit tada3l/ngg1 n=1 Tax=Xenopsylla cheopis TaxID=163159 RepID=A0A6M2DDN1_XENCH
MLGKRASSGGKGRSSIKHETNNQTSKTSVSMVPGLNKQNKSIIDDRKMRAEAIATLPVCRTQDLAEHFPTYAAVLARSSTTETVLDEELDSLQFELESMLSSLAYKMNLMHIEIDVEDYIQKDHNKRLKLNVKQTPGSGNRKRTTDKTVPHKAAKLSNNVYKSKNFKKVRNSGINEMTSDLKSDLSKPVVIKNDIAFKFWTSIDPYCAQLGPSDLDKLSKIINNFEEPLPAIPELGPHYTKRWTADDFLMEQNFSSDRMQARNIDMNLNIPAHIATMLKQSDDYNSDIPGPLTQRLLSALLTVPEIENIEHKLSSDSEKLLRKELISLGIMDEDDFPKPSPDDEVWEETKRVYLDLTALNKQNIQKLKELHVAAQIEVKKTAMRKKLELIDSQILEATKKFQLAKQENRQISEKELQDAEKLLKEQIMLNEKIISMPSTGPHWI